MAHPRAQLPLSFPIELSFSDLGKETYLTSSGRGCLLVITVRVCIRSTGTAQCELGPLPERNQCQPKADHAPLIAAQTRRWPCIPVRVISGTAERNRIHICFYPRVGHVSSYTRLFLDSRMRKARLLDDSTTAIFAVKQELVRLTPTLRSLARNLLRLQGQYEYN